ncbi:MAG: DNA polymerase domain-containing protein [Thermodesulfobacteriota bacterium]
MISRGRLLDLYVHQDLLVHWFRLESGELLRLTDSFAYRFYAGGPKPALQALEKKLDRYLRQKTWTRRREFWSGRTIPVREYTLYFLDKLPEVQRLLAAATEGLTFYNCDLGIPQYYAWEKKLFPLCVCEIEWEGRAVRKITVLDSPWDPDAPLPDLKVLTMELAGHPQIPLDRGNSLRIECEGTCFDLTASNSGELLDQLQDLVKAHDPDLILTRHGDARIFPFLWQWAQKQRRSFPFDRDPSAPGRTRVGQGRSYFSYGQVLYQSTAFSLYGRLHIDQHNSFFFRESGLAGIMFLARLTKIPLQTLARTSPGTAITAMQLDRALEKGILIPWKKGRPETFKSAWDLLVADKGGLVLQPPIGLWEEVAEIDFVSMYPNIMVQHNISPETMLCRCCPEPVVPEAGYNICRRRKGLVPETLEPILALRTELKARKKAGHPEKKRYDGMQKALKWMLVTCFGYMGYKNARFGCIEAHEAITAFGRDKLLQAKEAAEEEGFRVLHGLTDSLWISGPKATAEGTQGLLEKIHRRTGVPISLEGIYHWIVFLPSKVSSDRPVANRYFGLFDDGTVKIRGIDCCRHDTPLFIKEAQKELLLILAQAQDRSGVEKQIPLLLDRLKEYIRELREGRVDSHHLVIQRRVGKPLEDYRVNTPTVAVLQELADEGITLYPGQRVGYLLKDPSSSYASTDSQLFPAPFLMGHEGYHIEKYTELTIKSTFELISVFDYNIRTIKQKIKLENEQLSFIY